MTVKLCLKQKTNENKAFFRKFNSIQEKITFTKEVEENNQLQLLDILITKDKTKFLTNVYSKTTLGKIILQIFLQ